MAVRRFVLAPLAEIAPDAVDPLTRRTVADLLENLDRRPGVIALTRSASDPLLFERLMQELDAEPFSWRKSTINNGFEQFSPDRQFDQKIFDRELRTAPWVLTDFWVEEEILDPSPELRELRSRLRPTFVVVASAAAAESLTDWAARNHPDDPMGRDVPILRLRIPDAKDGRGPVWRERMLAEILAACASARG